jgi:sugar phosphate isomerase/epimerase
MISRSGANMITRRRFTTSTLSVLALAKLGASDILGQATAAKPINSTIDGVLMGVQSASFTFSGMGLKEIIETMRAVGLSTIDVMSEHVENFLGAPVSLPGAGRPGPWVPRPPRPAGSRPPGFPSPDPVKREALRQWRLNADLAKFHEVGQMFTDAGLQFFAYNLSFDNSFTDQEMDKTFLMTKALGTKIITASSPVEIFPRLKPFAEKHDVIVALHNHTIGPKEFEQAMALSDKFWVNLDVGHFFASGFDPVSYLQQHHARITNIHIKDRKSHGGDSVPFGDGETPLPAVFQLMKKERYGFPACIEYVGPAGPAIELASCLQYCKDTIKRS